MFLLCFSLFLPCFTSSSFGYHNFGLCSNFQVIHYIVSQPFCSAVRNFKWNFHYIVSNKLFMWYTKRNAQRLYTALVEIDHHALRPAARSWHFKTSCLLLFIVIFLSCWDLHREVVSLSFCLIHSICEILYLRCARKGCSHSASRPHIYPHESQLASRNKYDQTSLWKLQPFRIFQKEWSLFLS